MKRNAPTAMPWTPAEFAKALQVVDEINKALPDGHKLTLVDDSYRRVIK